MNAITLRNLPPALQEAVRQRARDRGISLNKAVLGLLEERLGGDGTKAVRRHEDLDDLAGSWSRAEAAAFDRALARQRGIDRELWKR